ncbi:MAG: zinc-ribbon domain-containing protein [Bryobacterales bacterium]
MPFCTQCGAEVTDIDRFCRRCGTRQPASAGPAGQRATSSSSSISPRAASILCYVPWMGWIAALFVLATDRFQRERDVRFHAYQGLYLFVGWMLVHYVVGFWESFLPGPDLPFAKLFEFLILILWIVMLVKTSKGERFSIPVVGELAERSL